MRSSFIFPATGLAKRSLLALSFSFYWSLLIAQVATFTKTYGTAGDDEAQFVHVLPDGSFLLAGSTTMGNHGASDALLVKFDASGNVLWSTTYGGASSEFFNFIMPCSDGNFIAYGATLSFGSGGSDLYLVKFDTDGQLIWSKTFGGANDEDSYGGVCEQSDGYVVTGATKSYGGGYWDIYAVKTGFDGNVKWAKSWGNSGGEGGGEPFLSKDGNVWISGYYYVGHVGNNQHDAVLMLVLSNGVAATTRLYGGATNEGTENFTPGGAGMTTSGHMWVQTDNGLHHQPWMLSYTLDGDLAWSKRYEILDGNYRINAENCPDGGFIFSPNRNGEDIELAYLIKTNQDGEVEWSFSYPYPDESTGDMYHAMPCPDGGYVAVGYYNGAGKDILLIKTNEDGRIFNCRLENADIQSFSVEPSAYAFPFVPHTAGGSLTANSQSATLDLEGTIICTTDISGVFDSEQPAQTLSITPNPAHDHIQIQMPGGGAVGVWLSCFNVLGQRLFASRLASDGQVEIASLPAGYYLLVAEDEDCKVYQGKFLKN